MSRRVRMAVLAALVITLGWWLYGCSIKTVAGDTSWGGEGQKVAVRRTIRVAKDARLNIKPGTTVSIAPRARLIVEGALEARGTEGLPIVFRTSSRRGSPWGGVFMKPGSEGAALEYVLFEGAGSGAYVLRVERSKLELRNVEFKDIETEVVVAHDSDVVIEDCIFPPVGENEVITGARLPEGARFIVTGCRFAPNTGYKDIIDYSDCAEPGPIPVFRDNIFLGGGDDGLDLDRCDAVVEGNLFTGFSQEGHDHPANAISLGALSRVLATNNLFVGNDHAIVVQREAQILSYNNTFVQNGLAAVRFGERGRPPGGGVVANCVFSENGQDFMNLAEAVKASGVTLTNNLLPSDPYSTNRNVKGSFAMKNDFQLENPAASGHAGYAREDTSSWRPYLER